MFVYPIQLRKMFTYIIISHKSLCVFDIYTYIWTHSGFTQKKTSNLYIYVIFKNRFFFIKSMPQYPDYVQTNERTSVRERVGEKEDSLKSIGADFSMVFTVWYFSPNYILRIFSVVELKQNWIGPFVQVSLLDLVHPGFPWFSLLLFSVE